MILSRFATATQTTFRRTASTPPLLTCSTLYHPMFFSDIALPRLNVSVIDIQYSHYCPPLRPPFQFPRSH